MQDFERLTKAHLDYKVIRQYTGLNGAVMMVGNTISLDENLGSLLCRKGYLKDVTARIADTITERVEDLESTSASHTLSIAAVTASDALKATEADLTLAENRITTLEGDITAVENRATTLEGDMSTAQGDITAVENRATTLEGDMSTAQGDITAVENRATTLEGDMSTAQGDMTAVENRATTLEGDIVSHDARLDFVEDVIADNNLTTSD